MQYRTEILCSCMPQSQSSRWRSRAVQGTAIFSITQAVFWTVIVPLALIMLS